ncbi:hypothetical protein GDO86_012633 [Hymenochirus boettgeri]|uniref:KRAB domain-containing protein n=1 Tax=Hymenochirus boettgeri TaxID=247094 RepID=A0A8T2ITJ7_9PIPI|nr:hypothetical protein GDO86_012633 [Hymenochirus boettgeri]
MAPTTDSREISKRDKSSIEFNEVAVYFSEEEWRSLGPCQKELYSNVMREIHTTLISLGYAIAHPDILCRIRKDQDPFISSLEDKTLCFSSTTDHQSSALTSYQDQL